MNVFLVVGKWAYDYKLLEKNSLKKIFFQININQIVSVKKYANKF